MCDWPTSAQHKCSGLQQCAALRQWVAGAGCETESGFNSFELWSIFRVRIITDRSSLPKERAAIIKLAPIISVPLGGPYLALTQHGQRADEAVIVELACALGLGLRPEEATVCVTKPEGGRWAHRPALSEDWMGSSRQRTGQQALHTTGSQDHSMTKCIQ